MFAPDASELRREVGVAATSIAARAIEALAALQLFLVYAAAVAGLWAGAHDPHTRIAVLIPVTLIAYFVLVSGPEAYARFRVPLVHQLANKADSVRPPRSGSRW